MATVYLSPLSLILQYFSNIGVPLAGGTVTVFLAGTAQPQATYTDSTGTFPNANPLTLNPAGRLGNVSIWQPQGVAIKAVIADSKANVLVTLDQLQGINDISVAESALANPTSGNGADLVANAVRSYGTFNEARNAEAPVLQVGQTLIVIFEGGMGVADELGGGFYWDASSDSSDDGINIIAPAGSATGRYLRLMPLAIEVTAIKPTASTVVSSTTPVNDPTLQLSLTLAGIYSIEGWLNDAGGSSTGGLKGTIAFSGTSTGGVWAMNGNGSGVTTVALTSLGSSAEIQSAQSGTASMRIDGFVDATGAGTLSLKWAQEISNGTPSLIAAGSWLRARLLAAPSSSFIPVTRIYSAGSGADVIPANATTLTIEAFGASGPGGNEWLDSAVFPPTQVPGTGGGSGGYARTAMAVSGFAGQTVNFNIGAPGSTTTVTSGTLPIATITANSGMGGVSASAPAGAGGTASGGTAVNTTGNSGNSIAGGAGIIGLYATGAPGGNGGVPTGGAGGGGLVVFRYT